ncbi:MAG: translation elongation factor Ts [Deltaproteobacteria bacterium]|nr:translation elongation factor Ts [Deltaproteobacteria bacterium]
MDISVATIKALREKTNAGMMDCKKALIETGGDMEKAVDWLRQKGLAVAAKRGDREVTEGQIASYLDGTGKLGALAEVNCETDFTGKTDEFGEFAAGVAKHVAVNNPGEADLMCQAYINDPSKTVEDLLNELRAKTGENVQINRFARFDQGFVASYIHAGGKLGVLVEFAAEKDATAQSQEFAMFAKDVAMHIAASNPLCVTEAGLAPEVIEREREVYKAQALEQGKPEKILDKIISGKMKKFISESCLLSQPFVKDTDKTVGDLLKEFQTAAGDQVQINRFARFVLGQKD